MVTEILRPDTVEEAVRIGSRPGAAFLGGGTWLNSGQAPGVQSLVSLERLGLDRIERDGERCSIGAGATFQQIRDAPGTPEAVRAAVTLTASRTLRVMVTVGGELGLCPSDSALIPVLIAMDAAIHLAGAHEPLGIREFRNTRPRGLILGVSLPEADRPCAVEAVARTSHGPRSLVVAVAVRGAAGGRAGPRIVLSDCQGQLAEADSVEAIPAAFTPRPDMHASAEYKAYMARVLADGLIGRLSEKGSRP